MRRLYTIGHSDHAAHALVDLLRRYGVDVVCDVRSQPYSGRFPWFSRRELGQDLRAGGIRYVFLGAELGARPDDPGCYVDGQARYDRIAATEAFRRGLDRVRRGVEMHTPALLCAEKDPLDCHRTILVCRALRDDPFEIVHVLADGETVAHADLERELVAREKLEPAPMFADASSWKASIERAYEKRGGRIAYRGEPAGHERGAG